MNLFLAIVMAIIFLVTPFLRGLFFDTDFYLVHLLVFILFGVQVVRSFINKDKIPTVFYSIFIVPIFYAIALFVAQTPNGALNQLFRWIDYAAFFIILLTVTSDRIVKSLMPYFFVVLGFILAVFAILGFFHMVDYKDVILIDPSSGDKRFTSTFQYANTFATVIGAFWLFTMVWMTDLSATKLKLFLLSIPLPLYALDFFHTYSRGALVLFPLAWGVGLLLLPFSRQILYLIYTVVSTMSGLLLFKKDTSPILIIALVIISGCVIYAIDLGLKGRVKLLRLDRIKFSKFFITAISVISGLLLLIDISYKGFIFKHLPGSLQQRLADINLGTYSVQGRNLFYHDAITINAQYPLLGVGGDGWKVLFTHVQPLPYWSMETHNGYLEVLLNTGWIGLIFFVAVFVFLFYRVFKGYLSSHEEKKLLAAMSLPALVMIFVHSSIDFNFSYGTVWFIVFFLFAMSVDREVLKMDLSTSKPAVHYSFLALLLALVSVFSIYTLRFYTAEREQASIGTSMQLEDAQALVNRNPYNIQYQIAMANAYLQVLQKNNDPQYKSLLLDKMKEIESLEPNNAVVMYNLGMDYTKLGQFNQAMSYFKKTLDYDHYNAKYYQDIMNIKSQLLEAGVKQKVPSQAKKYAGLILSDYQMINEWMNKMQDKKLNPLQINERNFNILSSIKLYASQAYFYEKKYDQAIPLLAEIRNDQDQNVRKQSLALLAAVYTEAGKNAQTQEILQARDSKALGLQSIYKSYIAWSK